MTSMTLILLLRLIRCYFSIHYSLLCKTLNVNSLIVYLFEQLQDPLFTAYGSPDESMDQLQVFDDGLCQVLQRTLCCFVSERSWFHSSLPYDLEDLSPFLCLHCLAALMTSYYSSLPLVKQLLSSHEAVVCD